MNLKTVFFASGAVLAAAGTLLCLNSCGGAEVEPAEAALLYVGQVQQIEESDLQSDSLLLYVDYSTCVAEAMNSSFFQEVQPTLVSNTPIYFSIKGDKINREHGDAYKLLRSVKEVNNADLLTAATQIAGQNRQAVLITDAEYWHPGVGDNLNNPYMEKPIAKWLSAGRDIYIYAEPYLESGKFQKKRYYIVFTDDRLPEADNINKKMEQAITSLGQVQKLHLSAKAPKAQMSGLPKDEDGLLLFDKDASKDNFQAGIPMLQYGTSLKDMAGSLYQAGENKAGKAIDLPFINGIALPVDNNGIFNIDDYDVAVYDLTPYAIDYATPETDDEGEPIAKTAKLRLEEIDDVFYLGEKELKNGEIALYFDEEYVKNGEGADPTLLRVDILADDARPLFDRDSRAFDILSWESISKAAKGGRNSSFFESVKQAVNNDKTINPAAPGRNVIYTLYIYAE